MTWQLWNYGRLCSPFHMSKTLQEKTTFLVHLGKLLEAAGYGGMLTAAVRYRYLHRNRKESFRLRAQSPRLSTALRRLLPWASSQKSSLRCVSSISSCFLKRCVLYNTLHHTIDGVFAEPLLLVPNIFFGGGSIMARWKGPLSRSSWGCLRIYCSSNSREIF